MVTMNLVTATQIAELLDAPIVRVRYVLANRPIKPHQRFGHTRAYTADVVDLVRQEIDAIDARRPAAAPP